MSLDDQLAVEVVFAAVDRYQTIAFTVKKGTTIQQAIEASGILSLFPAIQLEEGPAQNRVGIWGELKPLDHIVQAHDRIEIYRPLPLSAQEARKKRIVKRRKGKVHSSSAPLDRSQNK